MPQSDDGERDSKEGSSSLPHLKRRHDAVTSLNDEEVPDISTSGLETSSDDEGATFSDYSEGDFASPNVIEQPPRKRAKIDVLTVPGDPMPIPELSTDDEENEDDIEHAAHNSTVYDAWNPFATTDPEQAAVSSTRSQAQQAQIQLAMALEKETQDPIGHIEDFRTSRVGFGFISDPRISDRLKWGASEKSKFCALISRRTSKDLYEIADRVGKSVLECQAYLDILKKGAKSSSKMFSYADIEAATEVASELVETTPPPSPEPVGGVVEQDSLQLFDVAKLKALAEERFGHGLTEGVLHKLREASEEQMVYILEQALHHQHRGGSVTTENFNLAIQALLEAKCDHDTVDEVCKYTAPGRNSLSTEIAATSMRPVEVEEPCDVESNTDADVDVDYCTTEEENEVLATIDEETLYLEAVDMRNSALDLCLPQIPPAPIASSRLRMFMSLDNSG